MLAIGDHRQQLLFTEFKVTLTKGIDVHFADVARTTAGAYLQ
jgi:hypothetical protein